MLLLTSVSVLLTLAPPDFLAGREADSIHQLFRGDAVAVSQSHLDMTGDGKAEQIVVVGRPGPTGVLFPIGLVVIESASKGTTPRFRVLASAVLDLNPAYDARSGSSFDRSGQGKADDLDGNGRPELKLYTRARGPRLSDHAVSWWQLEGDKLRPIYHLQQRWITRHTTEQRSMVVVSPGVLEERIERTDRAGATSTTTVQLLYDRFQRKFVAASGHPVGAPAD